MNKNWNFLVNYSQEWSWLSNKIAIHKFDYLEKKLDRLYSFYLFQLNCMLLFINKLIARKNKSIHFDFRFIHFQ